MQPLHSHYTHTLCEKASISRLNNENLRIFYDSYREFDETADQADAIKLGAIKAVKLG